MTKRGGKTVNPEVVRQSLEESRQIMTSLIDILETEIRTIGDSGKISSALYEQLLGQIQPKTERLQEIVATLRENGVSSSREDGQLFARIVSLITKLEEFDKVGGRRRRRSKTVRKK
jgi:hypothetical protein